MLPRQFRSLANAAGGIIVFGIKGARHGDESPYALEIDPIQESECSKETLEHIIQLIRPRIEGVTIRPIRTPNSDEVCYVVQVPQSNTAHQAQDRRYYRRFNFNAVPMEDYEIRDVMNRRGHPKIHVSISVKAPDGKKDSFGLLQVKLQNIGQTLARDYMVDVQVPANVSHFDIQFHGSPDLVRPDNERALWHVRLLPRVRRLPAFPGTFVTLSEPFYIGWPEIVPWRLSSKNERMVNCDVFVDDSEPIRGSVKLDDAISGWAPLEVNASDREPARPT